MKLSVISLAFTSFVSSLAQQSPGPICSNSQALRGVYINSSVPIGGNPLTPFDSPMIHTFNATAVEDWSFDAVEQRLSETGAQRVILTAVWPNGTRFIRPFFFDESTIKTCPGTVTGTWSNVTGPKASWEFQASDDYKHTLVIINSTDVKGTYKLTSTSPPLYPNGLEYPDKHGDPLFAPLLYWVENVPVGLVEANLTILGMPFILHGIGGRERNWNSKPWGEISAHWDMARGAVGPYAFITWSYLSNIDQQNYFSMVLMKHGAVVFRSQTNGGNATASKKYGSVWLKRDGPTHLSSYPPGKPANSSVTGYVLEMVNASTGQVWKFDIDFTKSVY